MNEENALGNNNFDQNSSCAGTRLDCEGCYCTENVHVENNLLVK